MPEPVASASEGGRYRIGVFEFDEHTLELRKNDRDHHVAYSLGAAYGQLGTEHEAVRWLRTAADTGFPCLTWFEHDPLLEPVRRLPEYADLLAYVRLRRDWSLSRVD
jgi:hypothetical protein